MSGAFTYGQATVDKLRARIAELEKETKRLRGETFVADDAEMVTKLRTELETAAAQIGSLTDERIALSERIAIYQAENAQQKQQIKELHATIGDMALEAAKTAPHRPSTERVEPEPQRQK